jgi:hypothetical protein
MTGLAQALEYVVHKRLLAYLSPREYMVNMIGLFYPATAQTTLA